MQRESLYMNEGQDFDSNEEKSRFAEAARGLRSFHERATQSASKLEEALDNRPAVGVSRRFILGLGVSTAIGVVANELTDNALVRGARSLIGSLIRPEQTAQAQGIETTPTPDQIESTAQMSTIAPDANLSNHIQQTINTNESRALNDEDLGTLMYFDISNGDQIQRFATTDNIQSTIGKNVFFFDNEQERWRSLIPQVVTLADSSGASDEYIVLNTVPNPRENDPGTPVLWYKNRLPNTNGSDSSTFMAFRLIGQTENTRVLLPADLSTFSNNLPLYERSTADQNILTENGYSITATRDQLHELAPLDYDQMTEVTQGLQDYLSTNDQTSLQQIDNGYTGISFKDSDINYQNFVQFSREDGGKDLYIVAVVGRDILYIYAGTDNGSGVSPATYRKITNDYLNAQLHMVYFGSSMASRSAALSDIPQQDWYPPNLVNNTHANDVSIGIMGTF